LKLDSRLTLRPAHLPHLTQLIRAFLRNAQLPCRALSLEAGLADGTIANVLSGRVGMSENLACRIGEAMCRLVERRVLASQPA